MFFRALLSTVGAHSVHTVGLFSQIYLDTCAKKISVFCIQKPGTRKTQIFSSKHRSHLPSVPSGTATQSIKLLSVWLSKDKNIYKTPIAPVQSPRVVQCPTKRRALAHLICFQHQVRMKSEGIMLATVRFLASTPVYSETSSFPRFHL